MKPMLVMHRETEITGYAIKIADDAQWALIVVDSIPDEIAPYDWDGKTLRRGSIVKMKVSKLIVPAASLFALGKETGSISYCLQNGIGMEERR